MLGQDSQKRHLRRIDLGFISHIDDAMQLGQEQAAIAQFQIVQRHKQFAEHRIAQGKLIGSIMGGASAA